MNNAAYRFRLIDYPGRIMTMIAPDCDPEEARHALENIFGGGRVIEVHQVEGQSNERLSVLRDMQI